MSQIAQLSEAEIEAHFHVKGALPVAFMLAEFARDHEQFSVQFGGGAEMFLTTPLAVNSDKGLLIFDCSGSVESNQRFLQSQRNVFIGRPGGIHVQFTTGAAREISYEGGKAFAVALPKLLVRLQRRDYFRIETPQVKPLQFFGRLPGGGLLNLPAHDISVAGIGIKSGASPDGLGPGLVLEKCHFSLPADEHDLLFSATVRHVTELEGRTGLRQWRIGMQFNDLKVTAESRIQRYITHVERERHELS